MRQMKRHGASRRAPQLVKRYYYSGLEAAGGKSGCNPPFQLSSRRVFPSLLLWPTLGLERGNRDIIIITI